MQVIRIIAVVFMVLCSADGYAQKKLIAKVDSFLLSRYYRANIDTNYLARPDKRWAVRLGGNLSSERIKMEGNEYGYSSLDLKADMKTTAQVKVSYAGLSLALSINPGEFSGKNTDWGLNFNTSGRRIGIDVTASNSKTLKGVLDTEGMKIDVGNGMIQQKLLYVTGYYAFNARKFSYAAAFTQSYIQKRSAGSWLLSAAFYGSRITAESDGYIKLNHIDAALGGGYGYNWVPGKGWLLHVSFTPTICFYSHTSLTIDDEYDDVYMQFPEFIFLGKSAIVYQTKKWIFGANFIYYGAYNGDKKTLAVMSSKFNLRAFIGMRF